MKNKLNKIMTATIPAMILMTFSATASAAQQDNGKHHPRGFDNYGGDEEFSGSADYNRRVETWCDSVAKDLSETLDLANDQANDSPIRAEETLVRGLERVSNNPYLHKGPLTSRAIFRGQAVIQIMKRSVGPENGADSVLDFTMKYYDFVIKTARELDHPRYGEGFNGREGYDAHLTTYIHNEVQMVLDSLAVKTDNAVFPKGSTSAFMNELVASIHFASEDLQSSESPEEFACAAKYLNRLADEIREGDFGGEKEAMFEVYNRATRLVGEIQPSCGCFNGRE